MKNIVITGGLGYIGTELCRIYSGIARLNNITVIDKCFFSSRVSQLKKWGINFVQKDILDKENIKKYLADADIVHHLAGITDVAYVKKDSSEEQDKIISEVAIKGTENIIKSIPKNCHIIFPSTHVIFDGLKVSKQNIDENFEASPMLAYSKGKHINESQIVNSGMNFTIFRLGSAYGYSGDATRYKIMPNLFSKISSENGVIKLFSGGKQLKSLVSVIDVARAFFEATLNNKFHNQIFNLSNENTTVKDVADICKKTNPKLKIEMTKDEIPNPGYTLSNTKLKNTGFKFLYNLEQSISEMVTLWGDQNIDNKILEYLERGDKEFIDDRGLISNYELTEPINLIGYIESKKGTVRANHYHPIQEQKCLLISGQYISVIQDLNSSIIETKIINPKDMVITKPNVMHTMVFTKDSVFLNLVRGEREHENYGITHTIRSIIVDENFRKQLLENYQKECRVCGEQNFERIINLGKQPLANNLIKPSEKYETYPLELNKCKNCDNFQLSVSVRPEKMFSSYLYKSSAAKPLVDHFEKAAKNFISELSLNKNDLIIDVGSNDGVGLFPFKNLGYENLLGIEPAANLAKLTNDKGIKTLNCFFDEECLNQINSKANLILASNVFAHSNEINRMTKCFKSLLDKKGSIIIEVQHFLNTFNDMSFDNIYHEHVNYWSLKAINKFFEQNDMCIYNCQKIDTHGGSIRVFISHRDSFPVNKSVVEIINEEERSGMFDYKNLKNYSNKVNTLKLNFKNNIKDLKGKYKNIYAFGAPAKASTMLNFFEANEIFDCIFEDNELKVGKLIPQVNIPIRKFEESRLGIDKENSILIVLSWNYFNVIQSKTINYFDKVLSITDLTK